MKTQLYFFVFVICFAVLAQSAVGQTNICEGEQPGDWCDDCPSDPNHNGYNECDTCLNHNNLMQNASTAKTKPRVLYVNDFVTFMNENHEHVEKLEDGIDLDYVVNMQENLKISILGNKEREVELLEYACDAGFDGLLLYNVGRLLSKGDTTYYYFDGDNQNFYISPRASKVYYDCGASI